MKGKAEPVKLRRSGGRRWWEKGSGRGGGARVMREGQGVAFIADEGGESRSGGGRRWQRACGGRGGNREGSTVGESEEVEAWACVGSVAVA